jgi:hypothetical protein
MPRISIQTPGSIPNHKLLKNLQLNGKYVSNDGGDEGLTIDAVGRATFSSTLSLGTISEVPSDTDKILMSDSGQIKYVTGTNLLSYIGGQASLTAGTNCTLYGNTLNVDDAFIKNDADDTMAGRLTIDVDFAGTTSQNSTGLYIDYDATGDTGSGQNIGNIAINASVNSSTQTNAGTVTNYGIYTIATGGTSGTQTSIGGYFRAVSADSNYALVTDGGNVGIGTLTPDTLLTVNGTAKANSFKVYEDGSNYVDIDVADDGELTIESTGTDADILLKAGQSGAEADINLQAMDGDIFMYTVNNYTNAMHFDVGSTPFFKMRRDGNNWASFNLDDNGALEIVTVDSDGAEGHVQFDIDGHVEFEGCAAGFDRISGSFDGTNSTVDFRTGNKAFLDCTGPGITNLKLTFPAVSGNFVLLLKHSTQCNITNYLVYESDGTAATGDADVKWPGGTAPTLTNSDDHVDILSFFWDKETQTCYGVASLDFQD